MVVGNWPIREGAYDRGMEMMQVTSSERKMLALHADRHQEKWKEK